MTSVDEAAGRSTEHPTTEDGGVEPRRRRLVHPDLISIGIILAAFLLPLRGLLRFQGPPMEEGFMLVFPERVLAGDVPNVDFLHLYGPGSLWVLAGVYEVFGVSLTTERLFGLVQLLGIVLAIYALARPFGRTVAVPCALISTAIIIPPLGLVALAWNGGLALALWGLVLALGARRRAIEGIATAGRFAVVAGILGGFALLYRPDLVLAVGLGGAVAAWGAGRQILGRLVLGLAIGVAPFLYHLAVAGPADVIQGMLIEPVFDLRGGRRLPIPPSWTELDGFLQRAGSLQQIDWPLPSFSTSQQIFLWFFALPATVGFLVAVAAWAVRRDRSSWPARVLLGVALFSVGIMPQAMQRVDTAHFAWVSCVPVAYLPVAIVVLARGRAVRWPAARLNLVAGIGVLLVVLLGLPYFTARKYWDFTTQSFGENRISYAIERNGRTFYYGRADAARGARQLIEMLDRVAEPGDRLFVGTGDLRKTPYSDAYLYYLYPELTPGTHYIEMDPGVANAPGSGLAREVRDADIVVLSKVWDDWDEPNDSRVFGPNRPNEVLRRGFCLVGDFQGLYELWLPRDGRTCAQVRASVT